MKKYLETLKNSILRKKNIIDHEVKYYKNIPLPSWIEISPIDACNRKCEFCPKSDESVAPDTYKKIDIVLLNVITIVKKKIMLIIEKNTKKLNRLRRCKQKEKGMEHLEKELLKVGINMSL